MLYTDYDFYTDSFMGIKIPDAAAFAPLERAAGGYIGCITGGDLSGYMDSVKMAVCAVCEVMYDFDTGAVKSETNDGYSVTYTSDTREKSARMYEAARMYLPDELLYRGLI